MKIKKIMFALLGAMSLFSSCDDKLDIVPRGMSTLYTVEDLAAMLNQEWRIFDSDFDFEMLDGNIFAYYSTPAEVYANKFTVEYAFIFGDESVDRVALCENDYRYSEIYQNIRNCNIAVSKLPDAVGDEDQKARFIAQGRILRAWFHFLAVNLFAAQYDEATADKTGGIAYVDNLNSGEQKTKLTVAQVYDHILNDCTDDIIAALSTTPTNDPFRFEADFGYAVRARVLFQMKRYEEAAQYARKAIAINPTIADRSVIAETGVWEANFNDDNNYMFILSNYITNMSELSWKTLTPEFLALYEKGDYVRDYSNSDEWMGYDEILVGAPGSMCFYGSGAPRVNVWGIRAEQMYYVLGESLIRTGHIDEGLGEVDKVRTLRIHPNYYKPFKGTVSTEKEAMTLLRRAKRVECLMTVENFFDNKRLNTEPEYAEDVIHNVGEYGTAVVKPNSKLWIYPFPMNATNFNPSLTQNI
ncbi:MAG: RagB/SusD family nutrient uptake outer membrane protein [Bacteroides sp.]|nr:RagB/SusD family nutrient uptake outer membrane protein [Bacteroides sp.]